MMGIRFSDEFTDVKDGNSLLAPFWAQKLRTKLGAPVNLHRLEILVIQFHTICP